MKNRLIYLFLVLIVASQGCAIIKKLFKKEPQPPQSRDIKKIKTIEISGILIDTLVGLDAIDESGAVPTPYFDSLVIDLDKINPNFLEFSKHHLKIKTQIQQPSLIKNNCPAPIHLGQPYALNSLDFGVLKIKMGTEVKIITNFRLTGVIQIKNYSVCNGLVVPTIDSLQIKASDLRARLAQLEIRINEIMKQYPDHAADMLKPDIKAAYKALDDIEQDLEFLKTWYVDNTQKALSRLNIDQTRMFSLEDTVEDIEQETNSPDAPFIVGDISLSGNRQGQFDGEVSFETGDWVINAYQIEQLKKKFWPTINRKIRRYKIDRPGSIIDVKVKVTGYADEQPISGDLADNLFDHLPDSRQQGHRKTERPFMNILLSERRADALLNYFISTLGLGPRQNIVSEQYGRGETYPPDFERRCPGDCPARRIAVISVMVLPKKAGGL